MGMSTLVIKQVRSSIKRPGNQKKTLEALGLRGINKVVKHKESPSILGMINVVSHLVTVEKE